MDIRNSAGESIEKRSFAIIDAEVAAPRPFRGRAWQVARRIVHSGGDLSLLEDLRLPDAAIDAGVAALSRGAPIFTDTRMLLAGISLRRPGFSGLAGVNVRCILDAPGLAQDAAARGVTRSRAGVEALGERLGGSIVAVGNAPTALLALLDCLAAGFPAPALVIGMPVGFVNAAESKELLLLQEEIPSLVLRGRRGGSPLAAAAVNALARLAKDRPAPL